MGFAHAQILSAFLPLRDKQCRAKCGYARDMNSILALACIDLHYRYRVDTVWNPTYICMLYCPECSGISATRCWSRHHLVS